MVRSYLPIVSVLMVTCALMSSDCNGQGWLSKATGGRISTPKPIQKIAPNGISVRTKNDDGYTNYYKNFSDLNRRTNTNPYNAKLGTGPTKTKSYKPKTLGTFDVNSYRNSVQQRQMQETQAIANTLGNIGRMIQQNQVRQQYQPTQTFSPQQQYNQPQRFQYHQPVQQYHQPQQIQYHQPGQQYHQPVQQYHQPQQVQYHNVQQPAQQWSQPVQTYYYGN